MSDAIDLSAARLGSRDSIDVRAWPIITTITKLTIHGDGRRMAVIPEFAQAKAWPRVPNVEGGPINWTLWMGHQIAGAWQILAICTCVDDDYVPTGNVLEPGHIASNLYYYADGPLARYQPALGEPTIFFLTSGCTRRANTQGIPQPGRSQVVMVTLVPGTREFSIPPVVVPPVVVTPPPATVPPPVGVPPPDPSIADLLKRMVVVEDLLRDQMRVLAETSSVAVEARTIARSVAATMPTHTTPTSVRVFGLSLPVPPVPLTKL